MPAAKVFRRPAERTDRHRVVEVGPSTSQLRALPATHRAMTALDPENGP